MKTAEMKKPESYDGVIGELIIKHLGANLYKTKDMVAIRNLAIEFSKTQPQQPIAEGITVPYQLCPKCHGDGNLSRYNSPALASTTCAPICDVCNGSKIIPTLPLSVNMPSDEEMEKEIRKIFDTLRGITNWKADSIKEIIRYFHAQITLSKAGEKMYGREEVINKLKDLNFRFTETGLGLDDNWIKDNI